MHQEGWGALAQGRWIEESRDCEQTRPPRASIEPERRRHSLPPVMHTDQAL